jgi:pullulanase/glycogen debranching enzyme
MPARPEAVGRRSLGAALLLAWAGTGAATERLADCDAAAPSRVLASSSSALTDARAAWLDARRLRWPGKPADARVRLLGFSDPGLSLAVGDLVPEGLAELTLAPSPAADPAAQAQRFAWLGQGATWVLDDASAARAPDWWGRDLRLVQLDAQGRVQDLTRLQTAGALDDHYTAAQALPDLGVRVDAQGAGFRLWAPTADAVHLCLYPGASGGARAVVPMTRDGATGSWQARATGAASGSYYTYLVDVFVPGLGQVRNRVTDPYAISLSANSARAFVANLDDPRLMPPGWAQGGRGPRLAAATDAVLYELHVRDFSVDDATVPAADRGKYLAFAAPGSAGMAHLRQLQSAGLTDVHLLPAYDFGSVPEVGCVTPQADAADGLEAWQAAVMAVRDQDCFNWGYDPMHFTAPEGSYSSDANDGAARVREFRAMVQALHAAGLRVGMDVVYNHTFASGQDPRSVLDRIVPGYYHRLDAKGRVTQSTCCENTATEHAMMAKLMVDSAVTWVRDYRIDSFRFDLMGHQPRAAMEQLQREVDAAAGRPVLLIGEGWNFGEVADGARFVQASQLSLGGSGIASFSDRARDAVRGGGCCDSGDALMASQGWANGLHFAPNALAPAVGLAALQRSADLLRAGLAGSVREVMLEDHTGQRRRLDQLDYVGQPAGFAHTPAEVVNYVENHDNLTLFDVNALRLPAGTPASERARVQVLALATVALSQGIAYFHAGGELLRSKSLDRNSYNSGDAFNRLDWTLDHNHFGLGLPPEPDNGSSWGVMRKVLADPSVMPSAQDIRWTRDAFLDLLRIRASTPLLRLPDAAAVAKRLSFAGTGPGQSGEVVAVHLDGEGLAGAGFGALAYLINTGTAPSDVAMPIARGRAFRLHPVQAAQTAADPRPRQQARFDPAQGVFTVPARTAVVFVAD